MAAVGAAYPSASPATWNRHVATVRSFLAWCARAGSVTQDPAVLLERRHVPVDHDRALSRQQVEQIITARDLSVRDRCMFRMLYETAARAQEVLRLNIEDLETSRKRASTVRKGGDLDVIHDQTGTARLLPHVIAGRTRGPLFLAERAPALSRAPAALDFDEATGRARLSYRRAAEIFTTASGGATLHQLRHSALTHLAEDGVPLPLLMAKSRHESLRTLQRYVRPGVEAVARLTAEHDPARRR
jgi:integrase